MCCWWWWWWWWCYCCCCRHCSYDMLDCEKVRAAAIPRTLLACNCSCNSCHC
jgi:hypothetical protein